VRTRFGTPDETLFIGEDSLHWLYASRGLAITMSHRGKAVLQYVHPEDFGWLKGAPTGRRNRRRRLACQPSVDGVLAQAWPVGFEPNSRRYSTAALPEIWATVKPRNGS